MLTRMAPYKPQIYSFLSRRSYWQYPARTVTPIPGAGFRVRKLRWAQQPLLLGLGLGQNMIESGRLFPLKLRFQPGGSSYRKAIAGAMGAFRRGLGQDMIESRLKRVLLNPQPEPPWKWKRVGWRGPYTPARQYTISGLGAGGDAVGRVIPTLASILADPELALSREGPGLVTAIDRHLMGPLVRSGMRHAAPYVIPPLIALLLFAGLGAFTGIKIAKKLGV